MSFDERRNTDHSLQDFIDALQGTGGIKTKIAENLGCNRVTVDRYLKRWKTAREEWEQEVARIGDKAERNIYDSIEDGNVGDSKWYVSRILRGKYAERRELTGADGNNLVIEIVEVDDWRKNPSD